MPSGGPRRFGCIAERRFRRALFGYRPTEVEKAFADAEREQGKLRGMLEAERGRVGELTEQLTEARSSREDAERTSAEAVRRVGSLEVELREAQAETARHARGLVRIGLELEEIEARAQSHATRLRLDALREAAEVTRCARDFAIGRPEQADGLLAALEVAIDRVAAQHDSEGPDRETGGEEEAALAPAASNGAGPAPSEGADAVPPTASEGSPAPDGTGPAPIEAPAPVAGMPAQRHQVSVDVGPFTDFSQLIRFEDAANSIGAADEISVRRFSGGRASIEVALTEPVDLLRELEERCDLHLKVRRATDGELILDLDE